jgi:hypothetical protein
LSPQPRATIFERLNAVDVVILKTSISNTEKTNQQACQYPLVLCCQAIDPQRRKSWRGRGGVFSWLSPLAGPPLRLGLFVSNPPNVYEGNSGIKQFGLKLTKSRSALVCIVKIIVHTANMQPFGQGR